MQIKQKKDNQSRKDDEYKVLCPIQNLGRCLHENEERTRQGQEYRGQKKRRQDAEQDACRRTAAYAFCIHRTEPLSRINRNTRTESHDEAEGKEHETACTADRGKCIHPKESPNDERIDKGIELLHHISCNQRKSKEKDQPCGAARRQILHHSRYLVTAIRSFS